MHKIGVVGDKDTILPFKALGLCVYPVITKEEARHSIDEMAKNNFGIIFVNADAKIIIKIIIIVDTINAFCFNASISVNFVTISISLMLFTHLFYKYVV